MLIVREFNEVMDYMNKEEKNLFRNHIEAMEAVIKPGVTSLRWNRPSVLEGFVRQCRKSCQGVLQKLKLFKLNMEKIDSKCEDIS